MTGRTDELFAVRGVRVSAAAKLMRVPLYIAEYRRRLTIVLQVYNTADYHLPHLRFIFTVVVNRK